DAVRLKRLEVLDKESGYLGKVKIVWDESANTLTVTDNGTGVTQSVIENHLSKVGSSRYQDPEFKKLHPAFSPISRFGIGILSAFMIADEVEIITCSPDEDEARHLSLRSVHGKYLIRVLPKDSKLGELGISPHGTLVKLKLRPSTTIADIAGVARRW